MESMKKYRFIELLKKGLRIYRNSIVNGQFSNCKTFLWKYKIPVKF